ncbi:Mannan endo-1 [Diplonema papillatum]|nr:Mannan endo-1 [Diplonema papillatum]|eukprot:gene12239-18906_t
MSLRSLSLAVSVAALSSTVEATSPADVQKAVDVLQTYYNASSGYWSDDVYGWWHQSNVLEAVVNSMTFTNSSLGQVGFLENIYNQTQADFDTYVKKNGYDDIAWAGLAWMRAYQLTRVPDYLNRSIVCFDEITTVWDDHCGGGVWWDRKKTYKNAITNELFLTLATQLYSATGLSTYWLWALQEWAWFKTTAMVGADHLIVDGLTENCTGTGPTWTYNQGVLMLGLYSLYNSSGDSGSVDFAFKTAAAVASSSLLTVDGVLQEASGMENPGPDGWQFKGIYMRYLGYLTNYVAGDSRLSNYAQQVTDARQYLAANAQVLLKSDTAANGTFGYFYQGPPAYMSYVTHSSGLDLVNAAMGL